MYYQSGVPRKSVYACTFQYLLALPGLSGGMTTREPKFVGLRHQLLDQSTLANTRGSADHHSTWKALFSLDDSRCGSDFCRRLRFRTFRCPHFAHLGLQAFMVLRENLRIVVRGPEICTLSVASNRSQKLQSWPVTLRAAKLAKVIVAHVYTKKRQHACRLD